MTALLVCLVSLMASGVVYAENGSERDAVGSSGRTPPQVVYTFPGHFFGKATEFDSFGVEFGTPVTGVRAGDLTVNGSPATRVTGSGIGPYVFTGYSRPAVGIVQVALAPGEITRDSIHAPPFEGDAWTVELFDPEGDEDEDGLTNAEELTRHSDPRKSDTDDDGLPDAYELAHSCLTVFINEALPQNNYGVMTPGNDDADGDGVTNLQEYEAGSDPCSP